jgi:hypothetical protein
MNLGIFSKARNFAHSNIEIKREEACPPVVVVFAQVKKRKFHWIFLLLRKNFGSKRVCMHSTVSHFQVGVSLQGRMFKISP